MSPSLFAANYELKHIASEDVIFTDADVGADISNVVNASFCHIDAAYGGEDYTAFTIVKKKAGKYYVYGRLWQKAVDEVMDQIIAERQRLLAGKIYCANETIRRWPSVRAGENKWIFPYPENADAMFNSAMLFDMEKVYKHFVQFQA